MTYFITWSLILIASLVACWRLLDWFILGIKPWDRDRSWPPGREK